MASSGNRTELIVSLSRRVRRQGWGNGEYGDDREENRRTRMTVGTGMTA